MKSMANYFIDKNTMANEKCIIKGKKYRFSILSDRLVRLEYSQNGVFEDRLTQLVVNRSFDAVNFDLTESDVLIQIKTIYFTLTYVKEKPFTAANLKVILNESSKEWNYGNNEIRNFGSSSYSLDNYMGNLKLSKGLYSVDGFSAIDDSNSLVLSENDEYIERENKEIDVYLFVYRRDFSACLKDYYNLSGYPPMIPRYALGNWWYKDEKYNMKEVGEVVSNFYENSLPLSVILLGNTWHDSTNNYSFNPNTYNDPTILTNFLKNNNIKLGLTISPQLGINKNDSLYNEAIKYFNNNGSDISLLPFNKTTSNLYFNFYINNLTKLGVDFYSLDYNDSKNINNLWLLNHYHYTYNPTSANKRGLILSRNPMIASHRYPLMFTGYTKVDWETLNILPYYNLSSANIGLSFNAHAIGGYMDGIENSELYMRYIQFGVFSPIFILASRGGKYYKREPWRWSKSRLAIIREYMQLRHKLIPYLYTEAYVYHKTGNPIIRPLYYENPKIYDEPLYKNEYYFGSSFLIAPITKTKNYIMNRVVQRIYLPDGMWYDFRSGKKYPGNNYYMSFYKDEDYPAFCKAGSIIPMSSNFDTNISNELEIEVFPGADNVYNLYEDDGYSLGYLKGDYLITNFEYKYEKNKFILNIKKLEGRGGSVPTLRDFKIIFRNMRNCITEVSCGNAKVESNAYSYQNDFIVEIKNVSVMNNVSITCSGNDIEIDAVNLINDDIKNILDDLEIATSLKEKIDAILFSDMPIKKKRIEIKKLKKYKLEEKFVKMFLNLLEYIKQV